MKASYPKSAINVCSVEHSVEFNQMSPRRLPWQVVELAGEEVQRPQRDADVEKACAEEVSIIT